MMCSQGRTAAEARTAWPGLLCGLAVVAFAGCAARAPAHGFPDLQSRLKHGATVYVIDNTGTETRGEVVEVTPSALTISVDGAPRRMGQETVRQVQTYGDPLWNGLLIGMAVATPGMLIGDPTYERCSDNAQMRCPNPQTGQRVIAIGVAGGIGAAIDAFIRGRQQIYVARDRPPASTARVTVVPRVGSSTAAIFVGVSIP